MKRRAFIRGLCGVAAGAAGHGVALLIVRPL